MTSAFTSYTTHETMAISAVNESIDQELSLDDLQAMNGGWLLLLISALLPGIANAPGPGDDVYKKPGTLEMIISGNPIGDPDGTAVWQPPGEEGPGPRVFH